jgi:hypothetical protein
MDGRCTIPGSGRPQLGKEMPSSGYVVFRENAPPWQQDGPAKVALPTFSLAGLPRCGQATIEECLCIPTALSSRACQRSAYDERVQECASAYRSIPAVDPIVSRVAT